MTADLRFPFQPVADLLRTSVWRAAEQLGISGTTYQHDVAHGISLVRAERIAVRLGVHPYELWPDMPELIRGIGPRLDDPCGCSPNCPLTAGDARHGTRARAVITSRRCRCAECRAVRARIVATQRERRRGRITPDDPRHGTPSFYRNHGCRCAPCTAAANTEREIIRRRTTRRRAKAAA